MAGHLVRNRTGHLGGKDAFPSELCPDGSGRGHVGRFFLTVTGFGESGLVNPVTAPCGPVTAQVWRRTRGPFVTLWPYPICNETFDATGLPPFGVELCSARPVEVLGRSAWNESFYVSARPGLCGLRMRRTRNLHRSLFLCPLGRTFGHVPEGGGDIQLGRGPGS